MGKKVLMKGNEAIGEAAIVAGCRHYFGYPITPQSELPAYLSKMLPQQEGGVFVQAESEVSAINMVYGCAGCGKRVMTSSSSPGVSLKQEGISYLAGAELPAVIVNIVRAGPGLGSISPEQSDYFQSTRGGGHGNYRTVVLAPGSVQEMVDLTIKSFELADKYLNPVLLQGDGYLGQMMEPVEFPEPTAPNSKQHASWATDCAPGRDAHVISSIHIVPEDLEEHNLKLDRKYKEIEKKEVMFEEYQCDDADFVMVAYGITSRIVKGAIELARQEGIKVGLLRPITLWPFPTEIISKLADTAKSFMVVELNTGQMIDDVKIAVNGKKEIHWFGRCGGMVPSQEDVFEEIKKAFK